MDWMVYIIRSGKKPTAPRKIGITHNLKKRVKALQTGNPYRLQVEGAIPCFSKSEAVALESYLHARLKKMRMVGEWFSGEFNLKLILADFDKKYMTKHKCQSWRELDVDRARIEKLRKENLRLKRENEKLKQDMDDYLDSSFMS